VEKSNGKGKREKNRNEDEQNVRKNLGMIFRNVIWQKT
jgi:hypothetical protein